jgi:hypothetical protein
MWSLKLNAREKTLGAGEKFEDFETHFRIIPKLCMPQEILRVLNTILYENEFQNPQIELTLIS